MAETDKTAENQHETPQYNPEGKGFNFNKFNANKKKMLIALVNTMGIVSDAARQANLDRTNHYLWIKDDPDYLKAWEEIQAAQLDFAESALMKGMHSGNPQLIAFYLRTKGKQRGYSEQPAMIEMEKVERAVITLPGGGQIDI